MDHIIVVSGPGAVWQSCMALWDQYASGSFTAWAYARNNIDPMKGEKITVGLPAGGTDTYTYLDPTSRTGERQSLLYLMQAPGWRSPLTKCYPNPLPDASAMPGAFQSGPRNLRRDMVLNWCVTSPDASTNDGFGPVFGINGEYYLDVYVDELCVATDVIGVYYGTPTISGMQGYPSDFVGSGIVVMPSAGGGGSVDLTGVIAAINNVATTDVTYTANNGGAVWSMRGMVRAGT